MPRYVIINSVSKIVEEAIIAQGNYVPPPGKAAIKSDTANIGDKWDGASFISTPMVYNKNVLLSIASQKQKSYSDAGVSVNVALDGQSPIILKADTTVAGRSDLSGLVDRAKADASFTDQWVQSDGTYTINATQIFQVDAAVKSYISATYLTFGVVQNAINSGAITTAEQIANPETVTVGTTPLIPWPRS